MNWHSVHFFILTLLCQPYHMCPSTNCRCGIKRDGTVYIYCGRKGLKSIPRFRPSLQRAIYDELILSNNNIQKIDEDSFVENSLHIKRLDISNNPIIYIHPKSFVYLADYLENLQLSAASPNIDFDSSVLKSLNLLKTLSLTSFHVFQPLPHWLEEVSLIRCSLEPSLKFLPTNLKRLKLDYNDLSHFSLPIFPSLETLSLVGNGLRSIAPLNMPKLSSLDLSMNGLSDIDSSLDGLAHFSLRKLILRHNQINSTKYFSDLPSINVLILDNNVITKLHDLPASLHELSLRFNDIEYIDELSFQNLNKLSSLSLASNPIKSAKCPLFKHKETLKHLDLSNLPTLDVDTFKSILEGLNSLESLRLESNRFNTVPSSISRLKNLKVLQLSHNPLKEEIESLANANLSVLMIHNCSLGSVPRFKGHLRKTVSVLGLNGNLIEKSADLNEFSSLETILMDSFLNCDCNSLSMRHWISQHPNSSIICKGPTHLNGIELSEISIDQLTCPAKSLSKSQVPYPTLTDLIISQSESNVLRVSWLPSANSNSIKGYRVTMRQLPLGPSISSPLLSSKTNGYEFPVIPAISYELCVAVIRPDGFDKHCRDSSPVLTMTSDKRTSTFKGALLIALVSTCILIITSSVFLAAKVIKRIKENNKNNLQLYTKYGASPPIINACQHDCNSSNETNVCYCSTHLYQEIDDRGHACLLPSTFSQGSYIVTGNHADCMFMPIKQQNVSATFFPSNAINDRILYEKQNENCTNLNEDK